MPNNQSVSNRPVFHLQHFREHFLPCGTGHRLRWRCRSSTSGFSVTILATQSGIEGVCGAFLRSVVREWGRLKGYQSMGGPERCFHV
jgi:hypothetical protein